jgi:hypothetical protein
VEIDKLNNRMTEVDEKLFGMKEIDGYKQSIETEMSQLLRALEDERSNHFTQVQELERANVKEKEALKNELLEKLRQAKIELTDKANETLVEIKRKARADHTKNAEKVSTSCEAEGGTSEANANGGRSEASEARAKEARAKRGRLRHERSECEGDALLRGLSRGEPPNPPCDRRGTLAPEHALLLRRKRAIVGLSGGDPPNPPIPSSFAQLLWLPSSHPSSLARSCTTTA